MQTFTYILLYLNRNNNIYYILCLEIAPDDYSGK